VRNSEDESVGALFPAGVKLHRGNRPILNFELTSGGTEIYLAAFSLDRDLAAVVEFRERDRGDTHAIPGAIGEEGFPKDVDAVASVGLVQLFIEGADEDDAPETFDGAFGLVAAAQPFEHGDAAMLVDVPGAAVGLQNVEHGPGDGEFVDENGRLICFDPLLAENGFPSLIIRKDEFLKVLRQNKLRILWTVLGEKGDRPDSYAQQREVGPRTELSGLITEVKGALHFELDPLII